MTFYKRNLVSRLKLECNLILSVTQPSMQGLWPRWALKPFSWAGLTRMTSGNEWPLRKWNGFGHQNLSSTTKIILLRKIKLKFLLTLT